MATATKEQSKSTQIRDYAKAHRKATANEIAEALGCSVSLVHNVRNKKKGKRTTNAHAVAATTGMTEASPAESCVTFVRAAGGFAEAKKMLLAAEFFTGMKIR